MIKIKNKKVTLKDFYQSHTILGLAGISQSATEKEALNSELDIFELSVADLLELLERALKSNEHRENLGFPSGKETVIIPTITGSDVSYLLDMLRDELEEKDYSNELGFKE